MNPRDGSGAVPPGHEEAPRGASPGSRRGAAGQWSEGGVNPLATKLRAPRECSHAGTAQAQTQQEMMSVLAQMRAKSDVSIAKDALEKKVDK